MPTDVVAKEFYEVSKLAKFPFEPYWPQEKLRICVTGAGGFIASHLARRLKSEGHYIIAVDWKKNEHMPVRIGVSAASGTFWQPSQPVDRAPPLAGSWQRPCCLTPTTSGSTAAATDLPTLPAGGRLLP